MFSQQLRLRSEHSINPIFSYINLVENAKPMEFPRHQHIRYEVIVVERGLYVCTLNSTELKLRPPQALLIKPGDWHADGCDGSLRYKALQFQMEKPVGLVAATEFWTLLIPDVKPCDQIFDAEPNIFSPLLEQFQDEMSRNDSINHFIIDGLLKVFFWHMLRALNPSVISPVFQESSADRVFIARLERLFEKRIRQRLPISEMAAEMGVGERMLEYRCRRIFNESPARCFARFKMDCATVLLHNTDLSIKEISHSLGFTSPADLSRSFKKITGLAPSDVRRKSRR